MTQPDKPVPARGARPQLFGEPSATKPGKSRQPDFGPSILATIDHTPRRDMRSRDSTPLKRVLLMSALALGVVVVYFIVKFEMLPSAPSSPHPTVVAVQAPAPAPVVKTVEAAASAAPVARAASAASTPDGAASIENVTVTAASSAEGSTSAPNVAASLNNIQQVLERSEAASGMASAVAEPRKAAKPAMPKDGPATAKESAAAKEANAVAANSASPASKRPSTKAANDDADLLAAMLPHLKRRGTEPTSSAYEKRCGQLTGDAMVECRAKFCNGREGVDPACPSAANR